MLANKVSQLHADAVTAQRIADFWHKQIEVYGEPKAEAFYRSLGLNHLEAKSIEWEGLMLSREPSDAEKMCIKGVSQAQDVGKASVAAVLMKERSSLIEDGITQIKKLKPATYNELVLEVPGELSKQLRDQLSKVLLKGKRLVAAELAQQKGWTDFEAKQEIDEEDDAELDDMTDLTDVRMANEVQARIASAAIKYVALGLAGKALWDAVMKDVGASSSAWVERIATGAANNVLNFGREREAQDRRDEWDRVEYSAILDSNVCEPCAAEDGTTAADEADLQPAPNPECEGGDYCRCFHIFINQ